MKAAGAVSASGDAYNKDNEWYTMSGGDFKLTQKAIDAVNAYRVNQARSTNQRIHSEAQAELDKTVNYTRRQITLTEKELKELDILRSKGSNSQQQSGSGSNSRNGSNTGKDPSPSSWQPERALRKIFEVDNKQRRNRKERRRFRVRALTEGRQQLSAIFGEPTRRH